MMRCTPRTNYYNKPDAPCKDCLERKVGCHCECEKYKEFKKKCLEAAAAAKTILRNERIAQDYEVQERIKNIKGRR